MPFYALIASPLGAILLDASETHLTGLHFTDQRDCPRLAFLGAPSRRISNPSAGMLHGHPERRLRVVHPDGSGGDLFGARDGGPVRPGTTGNREGRSFEFLQQGTPAGAQAVLRQAARELKEYWRGRRHDFDIPMEPPGTAFQKQVWDALCKVPFGTTLSYGELAQRAGLSARHGRPAGAAVGANPISIFIPCHRVLAHDGTLNGYGGGLDRKIRLLEIEGLSVVQ